MKVYEGARGLDGAIVIVDGKPLPPPRRAHILAEFVQEPVVRIRPPPAASQSSGEPVRPA
jgi:hypothetical protein